MITITVNSKSGNMEIKTEGHAGYAEPGKDIVCASVSAILQTAVLGLYGVADAHPEHVKVVVHEE